MSSIKISENVKIEHDTSGKAWLHYRMVHDNSYHIIAEITSVQINIYRRQPHKMFVSYFPSKGFETECSVCAQTLAENGFDVIIENPSYDVHTVEKYHKNGIIYTEVLRNAYAK